MRIATRHREDNHRLEAANPVRSRRGSGKEAGVEPGQGPGEERGGGWGNFVLGCRSSHSDRIAASFGMLTA